MAINSNCLSSILTVQVHLSSPAKRQHLHFVFVQDSRLRTITEFQNNRGRFVAADPHWHAFTSNAIKSTHPWIRPTNECFYLAPIFQKSLPSYVIVNQWIHDKNVTGWIGIVPTLMKTCLQISHLGSQSCNSSHCNIPNMWWSAKACTHTWHPKDLMCTSHFW
jgi:hypothetical protein